MSQPTDSRGSRVNAQFSSPFLDQLEPRRLLSTVEWDGGTTGNGTNLADPLNWAGDVLPGPADDAIIGATGTSPTLTLAGVLTLNSLTSSRTLQVNSGGNLGVATTATLSASLNLTAGRLTGGTWNLGTNRINTSGAVTLTDTQINGTVQLNTAGNVTYAGSTRATTTRAANTYVSGGLILPSGYVFRDTLIIDSGSSFQAQAASNAAWTIDAAATVTIAGACTFVASSNIVNNGTITVTGSLRLRDPLVNNGTMSTGSTGTIESTAASLVNAGTLRYQSSQVSLIAATAFSNPGQLVLQNAELRISSAITWSAFNIGGFQSTNGTLTLEGVVDVTGTTMHITSQLGTIYLAGGTLRGGILDCDAGTTLRLNGGVLRDIQVLQDLTLQDRSSNRPVLTLAGSTTFPVLHVLVGDITFDGFTLNNEIDFDNTRGASTLRVPATVPAVVIGPSGVVRLTAGATNDVTLGSYSDLPTFTSQGRIEQLSSSRSLFFEGRWANEGVVRAAGGTCSVGGFWNNRGSMIAEGGSTFQVSAASWQNSGLITVNNALMRLNGSVRSTDFNFEGVTVTNGSIEFRGTLDNTDSTITYTPTTYQWLLRNGTIVGGTITTTDNAILTIPAGAAGTFRNVNFAVETNVLGTINLDGNTRFQRMHVTGSIYLLDGFILKDEVILEGTVNPALRFAGSGVIASTAIVRVAPSAAGFISIGGGSAINYGLLQSDCAVLLTIQFSTLTNFGIVRANAGSLVLIGSSGNVLFNPGQIDIEGGTVKLGGTIQGSSFNGDGITRHGGQLILTGTLNNAGNVLSLVNAGSLSISSEAAIVGGRILLASGEAIVNSTTSSFTFSNVMIDGDIIFSAGMLTLDGPVRFNTLHLRGAAWVTFLPTAVLRDTVLADGTAPGIRTLSFGPDPRITTIAAGARIEVAADSGGELQIVSSSSPSGTLLNSGTLRASSPTARLRIMSLNFQNDSIVQSVAGNLSIEATSWLNTGRILTSGGVLSLSGAWSSTGSMNLQNTISTFGGTFTTAGLNLDSFTPTGGTLTISGAWDNSGSSVTLAARLGPIALNNGRISGGTLIPDAANSISVVGSGSDLFNVQVNGDILVLDLGSLTIRGSTRFSNLYLRGTSSVTPSENYILRDQIIADASSGGTRNVLIPAAATLTVADTGSIQFASNTSGSLLVRGVTTVSTLVNNGRISMSAPGRTLTISPSTFTNNGILAVADGRLLFNTGILTSLGRFQVSGGTLSLGGTFNTTGFDSSLSSRTGGVVEIVGNLLNTGRSIVLDSHTGSWNVSGGTITGGQVNLNDGTSISVANAANSILGTVFTGDIFVLPTGDLTIGAGTRFVTAHLRGNVNIDLVGGFTLLDTIVADGPATTTRTIRMFAATTTSIAPSGVLRLAADCGGDLTFAPSTNIVFNNAGAISNESPTRTLSIRGVPLTNSGTVQTLGGPIQLSGTLADVSSGTLNGGTWRVAGTGTITGFPAITRNNATIIIEGSASSLAGIAALSNNTGTLILRNGAQLAVTPSTGTFQQNGTVTTDATSRLVITGGYQQGAAGVLNVLIAGTAASQIGGVSASGAVVLNGTLTIALAAGYTPAKLDHFDVVAGTSVNGTFVIVSLPSPLPVGKNFLQYTGTSVRLVTSSLADANSDGVVDFFDYLDFIQAFSQGSIDADFNGDTTVDFFDYLDFLAEFSQF